MSWWLEVIGDATWQHFSVVWMHSIVPTGIVSDNLCSSSSVARESYALLISMHMSVCRGIVSDNMCPSSLVNTESYAFIDEHAHIST